MGAAETHLSPTPNRIAQGLVVGLLVTAGFLGVFIVVGLPISYGATLIAQALPWTGMGVGLALLVIGLATLSGRRIALPVANPLPVRHDRHATTMLMFGVGYGIAS